MVSESEDGPPDSVAITTEGLAVSRSRRPKKDKYGRQAVLQRLKESKNTGQRIKYEVANIQNVYEEVGENEYSDRVKKRLDDDWIEDDGAGEYVEDGREIFDDEIEPETSKKSSKKQISHSKKPLKQVVKSSDIKNMLMASHTKKKTERNVDLSKDELLGDILQEIQMQTSDPLSVARGHAFVKKKKSLTSRPGVLGQQSYASTSATSHEPRRVPQLKKLMQPNFNMDDLQRGDSPEPEMPPMKRSKLEEVGKCEDEVTEHDMTFNPADFEDIIFDEVEDQTNAIKPSQRKEAKPFQTNAVKTSQENSEKRFVETLSSLGWETSKNHQNDNGVNSDVHIDTSSLPTVTNHNGEQVFRFFWLDAYEDLYHKPGVVYMFGKVYVESAQRHVSCCLTVKNIERTVYLLPRETNVRTGERVTPQDVYQEFDTQVADKHKIMKFKTKIVEKKNVFGGKEVPHEAQYLQISYPAEYGQLSTDLTGDTFSCVFGVNQPSLESLLLHRNICGPCWLDVFNPQVNTAAVSWCKMEVTTSNPCDVTITDLNLSIPPLVVLSISLKTLPNIKTHQNEIVGIAGLIHSEFPIDKPAPSPAFEKSFFGVAKPVDCVFPYDFRDAAKKRNYEVEIFGTERSLLGYFLAKMLKVDPDIVVGHSLLDFNLDVILHRLGACKVAHWSRIGRLRKLNMPKIMGGGRFSDRSIASGRLLCDIKISAKELIRCKSYDLAALSEQVLHKTRQDLPSERIKDMFSTSDSLLWLAEHTLVDASAILDITGELNVLPLALQITNIAGNVMSRTLMGGRSERNEFLLLHAFHDRGYLPPDRSFKKQEITSKADGDVAMPGQPGRTRKKAAYEGGLVLEPKRGFYDKYILLLDFNSLYPSIIQEYNICFTTLDCHPPNNQEVESWIPEVPEAGLETGVLPTEIRKLVERRREVKKLMKQPDLAHDQHVQYDIRQKALKLTANSMYGCLGFSNSRFYAKPLAALVTRQGREILMHTKELAQKMGLEVIYGDTDSIMINTNSTDLDNAFKLGNQVKAEVNKLYRLLEIDIDGVYKSLLLLKKKKYAALSVQRLPDGTYKNVQELKGLDIVRRDWCDLAKQAGNFAVDQILSDQPREIIVEKIHENLEEICAKVKDGSFPNDVFLIRKELTKDPELYPGKDNLPHVRVALRVNHNMTKRLKSGDIVAYVICKDGSTAAATHRSYALEELTAQDHLTIDSEYYLGQQVHPVVTRLCEPIDGTDAALIAQCLGLDASGFKSARTNANDDDDSAHVSVQANEEEKYSACQNFVFVCPTPKQEFEFSQGVFAETDPTWLCTLMQPSGKDQSKIVDHLESLKNQLTMSIRKNIRQYYKGWMVCDDPACAYRTRVVPCLHDHTGAICSTCFKGIMRPELTYRALYQQLCYYKLQFDVDYALRKYKQDANNAKGNIKIQEYRRHYQALCDIVDTYLKQSGYNHVSLQTLFHWMKVQ